MELKDILLDREGGAMSLLKRAVIWLEEHPERLSSEHRDETLEILRATRPVMAAFARLADHLAAQHEPGRIPSALRDVSAELEQSDGRIARRFLERIRPIRPVRVVTLSWSATVLYALREGAPFIDAVYVLESHPGGEGIPFAEAVRSFHPAVKRYPDEALEDAVRNATVGVIGADTVFPDGSVVNKVLSAKLAEALYRAGKPLYVLASAWKRCDAPVTESVSEPGLFELVRSTRITEMVAER